MKAIRRSNVESKDAEMRPNIPVHGQTVLVALAVIAPGTVTRHAQMPIRAYIEWSEYR